MRDIKSARKKTRDQCENAMEILDKAISSSPQYSTGIWISVMAAKIAEGYIVNNLSFKQYKLEMLKMIDYYEKKWDKKEEEDDGCDD